MELEKEYIEWNNKQEVDKICSIMSILGNRFKKNIQKDVDKEFELYINKKKVKKHLPSEFEIYRFLKPIFVTCYNHLENKYKNQNQYNVDKDYTYKINYLIKILKNRNELPVDIVIIKNILLENFKEYEFDVIKQIFVLSKNSRELLLSLIKFYSINIDK